MLFQSDYWVAASVSECAETLRDFLGSDEGIKTLVIIQKRDYDSAKIMDQVVSEGYLSCNVNLVLDKGGQTRAYEPENDEVGNINHMKTIYVCDALDDYAVDLLRTLTPILALFV